MSGVVNFRILFCCIIALFISIQGFGQKTKKPIPTIDTLPAPIFTLGVGCTYGIPPLSISVDENDTNLYQKKIYLYKLRESISPLDTLTDSLKLIKIFSFKDIEKTQNTIIPENEGTYAIQLINNVGENKQISLLSSFVTVNFCSVIKFDGVFDKTKNSQYTPRQIVNVQVKEFNIFDRVGETVYTHNNNTILWDGKDANGQPCNNGIYYYHCEYVDMAHDGEKKSLSGMIELKNQIR